MAKRKAGGGVVFELEGADELKDALARLAVGVRTRVLRAGMSQGMDLITDQARRNAPPQGLVTKRYPGRKGTVSWMRTGTLRDSIRTVNGKTNSKWKVLVLTRAGEGYYKGDQFYAGFIEFGTQKDPPYPFLTPAFDSMKGAAMATAKRAILAGIEQEVLAAAFRKTTIGRAVTRTRKAYNRASKRLAKVRKRTTRIARKARKTTTRATRRLGRSTSRIRRRASKSLGRLSKTVRKTTNRRLSTAAKSVRRTSKTIRKSTRKASRSVAKTARKQIKVTRKAVAKTIKRSRPKRRRK